MAQRPPSSRIAARNEATNLMGVLRGMMESQHEQTALLRDGLLAAQQMGHREVNGTSGTTAREHLRLQEVAAGHLCQY